MFQHVVATEENFMQMASVQELAPSSSKKVVELEDSAKNNIDFDKSLIFGKVANVQVSIQMASPMDLAANVQ